MNESAAQAVHRSWLDALGAAVSVACAIQCAALPFLITALPFPLLATVLPLIPTSLLPGRGFDRIALAAAIVLAVASFSWGFSSHRRAYIFIFLLAALSLIGSGWLWVAGPYQIFFVVIGALILAAGHMLNRRLCRICRCCRVPESKVVPDRTVLKSSSA